jgi:hypothetical protein
MVTMVLFAGRMDVMAADSRLSAITTDTNASSIYVSYVGLVGEKEVQVFRVEVGWNPEPRSRCAMRSALRGADNALPPT